MTSNLLVQAAFWLSAAVVVYSYLGYPLLIWWLTRHRQAADHGTAPDESLPTASLLIAAHNESEVIEARIRNALALDYPADKLEIVVASDGSTDGTNEIVRRFLGSRVRLLEFAPRRGKASVLNGALHHLRGELVMFSDANTLWDNAAARGLARWFSDPAVGVVCGRLNLVDAASGNNVDSLYWRYETFLKRCEARLGVLLGANGAIYALRRGLFEPIPNDTIIDDFVIPLSAYLRSGCRMIYDPSATATEETPAHLGCEFRRRTRIGAGGFQSIARLRSLTNWRHGWLAFAFVSHKLCRWLAPFALLTCLAANVALVETPCFGKLLAIQAAFYSLAAVGGFVHGRHPVCRVVRATTLFAGVNLALLVGCWRWLSGHQRGIWHRTARPTVRPDLAPVH